MQKLERVGCLGALIPAGIVIAFIAMIFTSGLVVGRYQGAEKVRKEAILKHFAHYINDEQGNPKFEWAVPFGNIKEK